jgi:hypothetical protein
MQVIHPRCAGLDVHKKTVVTTMMLTQKDWNGSQAHPHLCHHDG